MNVRSSMGVCVCVYSDIYIKFYLNSSNYQLENRDEKICIQMNEKLGLKSWSGWTCTKMAPKV
ncbi:unnamed protein product [Schistosoma haematobium]|nr:unnamed protein product [Schistosoma haematobium]